MIDYYSVGRHVYVESDTSPGKNLPGGAGQILEVEESKSGDRYYTVKYSIEGGSEKRVPMQRLKPSPHEFYGQGPTKSKLRERTADSKSDNEQKEKEEEVRTTWERPFSRQPKLTEKMAGGVEKSEAC